MTTGVNIWLPLVSSIIGGVLVWGGQYIERHGKRNIERENTLLEIYSYCRKMEALMITYYRELAAAKTHAEYWFYASDRHDKHDASQEVDLAKRDKFYGLHLQSQQEARQIERTIGETKAAYVAHVRKYHTLRKIEMVDIRDKLHEISVWTLPKAMSYSNNMAYHDVRGRVAKDEAVLRHAYYEHILPYTLINNYLEKDLKEKFK